MSGHSLSQQEKVRVFGNQAAMTAEATIITKERSAPVPTINLEVAPRKGADVNWEHKIIIQLSDQELPLLCATFMGYMPSLQIKRPGKGIELMRQPGGIYIKASAGRGALYVLPANVGDSFRLCALFLRQLKLQSGLSSETLLLAALRGSTSLA